MHSVLGMIALAALLLSALASLLTRLTLKAWRERLLRARRTLGLVAFGVALLHATASLVALHAFSFSSVWNRILALRYVQHGALALLVLLTLTLTSFPTLNARLGLRTWSALHRLAYAALVLAALHALEGPNMDPRLGLLLLVSAVGIVLARVALSLRRSFRETRALARASREGTEDEGQAPTKGAVP